MLEVLNPFDQSLVGVFEFLPQFLIVPKSLGIAFILRNATELEQDAVGLLLVAHGDLVLVGGGCGDVPQGHETGGVLADHDRHGQILEASVDAAVER